jgi:hypothetical protein
MLSSLPNSLDDLVVPAFNQCAACDAVCSVQRAMQCALCSVQCSAVHFSALHCTALQRAMPAILHAAANAGLRE